MNIYELKTIICTLANSQGFYGRLLQSLNDNKSWDKLLKIVNENNIKSDIDFILFIEG